MSPGSENRLGPEFSRPFAPDTLGDDEVVEWIEATQAERHAVARRLGLVALDRLAAELRLRRVESGEAIAVAGHIEAEATQSCVVSLQPVQSRISEDFTALYTVAPDGGEEPDAEATVEVDALGEDPPEALGPEGLDLGEAVVLQLALALEPYPRRDDASLESLEWRGEGHEETGGESPFKGLKTLIEGRRGAG